MAWYVVLENDDGIRVRVPVDLGATINLGEELAKIVNASVAEQECYDPTEERLRKMGAVRDAP